MVTNLEDNAWIFSTELEKITVSGVSGNLNCAITVDDTEALRETYYPDSSGLVTIYDIDEVVANCFHYPSMNDGADFISVAPLSVNIMMTDNSSMLTYTLHVIYSRFRTSMVAYNNPVFLSRYKLKSICYNSIDYISFFRSDNTQLYADVIYIDNGQSVKKTVLIDMDSVDMMVAYNVRLPKIAGLAGVNYANILSFDLRITNGQVNDLIRYIVDKKSHREIHQFLYYNPFGLPESVSFVGLVQHAPELDGDIAVLQHRKMRVSPYFNELQTLNTGYLDSNKYQAVIDMLYSPQLRWYDTKSVPMDIVITEIDFTHTLMKNSRVNVNFTFCPADRKYRTFDRMKFSGGIFDYTFDKTFE